MRKISEVLCAAFASGMTDKIAVHRDQVIFVCNKEFRSKSSTQAYQNAIQANSMAGLFSKPDGNGWYRFTEDGYNAGMFWFSERSIQRYEPASMSAYTLSNVVCGIPVSMKRVGTEFCVTFDGEVVLQGTEAAHRLAALDPSFIVREGDRSQPQDLYSYAVANEFVLRWEGRGRSN